MYSPNVISSDLGSSSVRFQTSYTDEANSARFKAVGTTLVAGDFALSAGWGTTATVSAVSGTDQRFRITVTSAGTGQGANPTITFTFQDGTWTNTPIVLCQRRATLSQPTIHVAWVGGPTSIVLTTS